MSESRNGMFTHLIGWLAVAVIGLLAVPSAQADGLLVSSILPDQVLRYGATGAVTGVFAGGGLNSPEGLVFGSDNNLYVSSAGSSQVLRYTGQTGAFIDAFVAAGGGLLGPTFLTLLPFLSGCVQLEGVPVAGAKVTLNNNQTRRTAGNGCYVFKSGGRLANTVTISLPPAP